MNGKALAFPADGDDVAPLAAALGDGRVQVHLIADSKASYQCMGGAIFALQRTGFSKFSFISDPQRTTRTDHERHSDTDPG